jgi:uncharacterized membrane protein YoaK (UPF0700 family)
MFTHRGQSRTLKHNLSIASFLSFVAGMVNVAGFLSVQVLTTNVTGHFAFFVDELFKVNLWGGMVYFLYIFFFFLGSFFSNVLVEIVAKRNDRLLYIAPILVECFILACMAIYGQLLQNLYPNFLAFALLFTMGLQNSMVTTISNATVRTTHLTGLFTDLGIDLSQLIFRHEKEQIQKLRSNIWLRLTIIGFFFSGGLISGLLYPAFKLQVLFLAVAVLMVGVIYDNLRLPFLKKKE